FWAGWRFGGGAAAPPPIIHVETPSGLTNSMDTIMPKVQIRLRTAHRPVTNIAPDRVTVYGDFRTGRSDSVETHHSDVVS
ncbi:MAG: hypothetical protein ND866_10230, partial [Pyrinomonadaceae bacterium]|nr:hypothetical protein [Pyrinomonadaceae bacterium]